MKKNTTDKTIVINPSPKEEAEVRMLPFHETLTALVSSILHQRSETFPKELITGEHVRKFVQKVDYKLVAVNKFAGGEVSSLDEAVVRFSKMGQAIYGDDWVAKLIKSEVMNGKAKAFGLICPKDSLVLAIQKELEGIAEVKVNGSNAQLTSTSEENDPSKTGFIETARARARRLEKSKTKSGVITPAIKPGDEK